MLLRVHLRLASRNVDGTPFTIPLGHPGDAPTPILRTISSLLSRDHSRALNPLLSTILIHVAEHLTDEDTARLPFLMTDQNDLSPISPDWLVHWKQLLSNETLVSPDRPQTRRAIMDTLHSVYEDVKDMTSYRRPLGDLVWEFCGGLVGQPGGQSDDADIMWKLIGEEIVLRSDEQDEDDTEGAEAITKFLQLLVSVASERTQDDDDSLDTASNYTADTHSPATITATGQLSNTPSATRTHSELPSVMSLLSSLAAGGSTSRSQSVQPPTQSQEEAKDDSQAPSPLVPASNLIPRDVSAISALVEIFSQLVFTPFSLQHKNLLLAIRVYHMLLSVIIDGQSVRARLTALQFLMHIRADRDHSLYFVSTNYDPNGLVASLGALINRTGSELRSGAERGPDDAAAGLEASDIRRARARFPQERAGRQISRGRGAGIPSRSEPSRSRSRNAPPPPPPVKPLESLWSIPETMPFTVYGPDSPSEVLVSYDPEGPDRILVLPISQYLLMINGILEKESSWEILSYVLCHLPVQLANKHLFCGPKSRAAISKMLSIICTGILNGDLGSYIDQWPTGLKSRDAHGLAYQTLSVLVSYRRCFDLQQRHLLVEVFQAGLNGQLATIKCCLHALSLSAFELQPSMTRCLSRILEKLSQIMSNPNMAVHILGFLSIIGSLPSLYANFTEMDFKMVFGVALQYLQHYNRLNSSPTMSWALSQHVRVLSYSAVYIWFLALKLPDRPRHIRYITRQLLLANEGNIEVDEPTEVCFDWLARYTYASADPRPANSVFSDIVLNPSKTTSEMDGTEKTWLMGNSLVTIRALPRSGWVEVLSRRPSGFSRFVCRVENIPMVGPGDVEPDLLSIPAGLIMERDPSHIMSEGDSPDTDEPSREQIRVAALSETGQSTANVVPQPDPITGYVWSGTAPSQRRKQIGIDPSFLILQLSPFPDGKTEPFAKRVTDSTAIAKFVSTLDRIPVIDTHKVGIMYVAPGQSDETEILRNIHGSPAYTRFLEGIGRLIDLRGQKDVYAGGLDPDEDGDYAYAWWDDIGQILYHTATMMPTNEHDPKCNNKKRHIGNDYVRIVWNDSALPYRFDTLKTQFQFVNIVIEPHSLGSIAAFAKDSHEIEYFKVTMQLAPGMTEFAPVGHFKLISADNLPLLVRQLSLLADWFATIFSQTQMDTVRTETKTNWHARLDAIRRFKNQQPPPQEEETLADSVDGVMGQESLRDFTTSF
ncbi:Tuberous sclerosis 2 protein-like protein [Psilocybe cubensis]|uniref:Tuberous sclerosis 2 protein-like protein n=1 Tax=Psilocybe cubensis TaxID=181762 RepID=A0ACB8GMW9_PSICU|nr:Tuberous sclerosis 2 protein-like protein [Psilocybe cubensis]KAH9477021.1 Tuberous sclerosis 2 protein-like protein [Psilocybe cubensis]